jgi:D-alanine-D-alanine ligase-like ATP-grasp enzyme
MEPDADTLGTLSAMALKAVQAIGEHCWSVDFAQDEAGKWWLIDMARAESSWHPKHK